MSVCRPGFGIDAAAESAIYAHADADAEVDADADVDDEEPSSDDDGDADDTALNGSGHKNFHHRPHPMRPGIVHRLDKGTTGECCPRHYNGLLLMKTSTC